jgi:Cu(I)/Ag(I) efflux system membrane fusion protein
MKKSLILYALIALIIFSSGVLFGNWFGGSRAVGIADAQGKDQVGAPAFYTCSMHPHVNLTDPKAKCPLCGMDLIPVTHHSSPQDGPTELTLSPRAMKLAEVETTAVERKFVATEIRMVGKVEYDETKLSTITAWVPGRLDRLYVDYTGVSVTQGDHLVDLYSPELLSAQEELLQAIQTAESLNNSSSDYLKEKSQVSIESSKEKLRLWGLSDEQINGILEKGQTSDHITINSPISGIVIHKNALEGMYVKTGTQVYTIADLSQVWVKLDAYESDLTWLHYGQEVEFHTEAYPGEVFEGQIAFIDPILNPKTRTIKIRVNLPNPNGKLKPDMFVRATVKSQVAKGGRIMNPDLIGKWISPMHPEIIKDAPGSCDICGMDLVSTESMGYVSAEQLASEAPLVIPASAPLTTGKRAVVYVEIGKGRYEGRVVRLGPRAGDYYIVDKGLSEGERVVSKGNFKIDSAIQILAKPSMMNPDGGGNLPGHHHGSDDASLSKAGHKSPVLTTPVEPFEVSSDFARQLGSVVDVYLEIKEFLSHDDFANAHPLVGALRSNLDSVDMKLLEGPSHIAWMKQLSNLNGGIEHMIAAEDVVAARAGFEHVSNGLITAVKQFGGTLEGNLYVYHCPMAFGGKGGDWIQSKEGTENPYYGSKMFSCGSLTETLVNADGKEHAHAHE